MTLQIAGRYPRRVQLRDGSIVLVRPMSRADEGGLVDFFGRVPAEERFFLKDDVTSRTVIRGWIDTLDYERVLPLLALDGNRVVGDAALLRHRSASLRHSGEIRVVIDPAMHELGLGVVLVRELVEIASASGLLDVVFEFVDGAQDATVEAAEFLGAVRAGSATDWVRDAQGNPHDVIFMRLPVSRP